MARLDAYVAAASVSAESVFGLLRVALSVGEPDTCVPIRCANFINFQFWTKVWTDEMSVAPQEVLSPWYATALPLIVWVALPVTTVQF